MTEPVPLLKTEKLTMNFGGVIANDSIDFNLGEMELRCLIGPNGAGKSTFFKMLTGQITPSSGTIAFRGRSIAGLPSHEIARAGLGIKTQVPNVFNGLSVRENIWLSARRKNTPRTTKLVVDEILERVRLTERQSAIVGQLSHGQRQWVEIGTVLAGDPELLLLDEPAAGMTDEETERTAEIIREINEARAIIVVEHDMEFIKMIARTVTVFHQGRIIMEGTLKNVLADPRVRDVYLGKKVVV
ncbi:ATP-binding cassette domain-containing protein [Bradyrhizobium glycinis]|uniref:ATP-binding cassette domain-containing protein n=1 Tax=Bradyrhizobium glycinis TaxID=2751812 RepID=UPI0018D6C3F5|nr:ATP-binding cassette domain-containing protein [Bradyrhizobium glycinis]MBH5370479.1 ATP-binding cassette domain-containing protein [Bradyrhizobium glycinis]